MSASVLKYKGGDVEVQKLPRNFFVTEELSSLYPVAEQFRLGNVVKIDNDKNYIVVGHDQIDDPSYSAAISMIPFANFSDLCASINGIHDLSKYAMHLTKIASHRNMVEF